MRAWQLSPIVVLVSVLVEVGDVHGRQDASAAHTLQSWPSWRGPAGTGYAEGADPPVQWSETENVRWRVAVPGMGHSTPVIWDNTVYLTTAVPVGEPFSPRPDRAPGAHDNRLVDRRYEFVVIAYHRSTGAERFRSVMTAAEPHEGGHVSASYASASPVTDGEVVIASFGSQGLYALDDTGALLWQRDLGKMQTKHGHGEGSSPAMSGDTVIVNWDHEGASFVIALDRMSGKTLWRVDRDEVTSWSSPTIVDVAGVTQVIVAGSKRVRGL